MLEKLHDDATFKADPRLTQWVDASKGSIHYEGYMQSFIRGLGWLDVELIALDKKYYDRYWSDPSQNAMLQPAGRVIAFKVAHLSELWVMGGWEVIRTIDDRTRKRQPVADQYPTQAGPNRSYEGDIPQGPDTSR